MLLLMTLALVVASAVLLILGFVQDALGFIYLSMLCAGVAALALIVFARLTRRRAALATGSEISARLGTGAPAPAGTAAFETRPVERTWARLDPEPEPEAEPEPEGVPSGIVSTAELQAVRIGGPEPEEGPEIDEEPGVESWADWGEEVVFPIEGYDDLRVAEIVPLLSRLDPDELQEVRDREVSGKARATILDRIDDRLGVTPARRAAAAAPVTPAEPAHVPEAVAEPTALVEPPAAAEPAAAPAAALGETLEQEAISPSALAPEPAVAKEAPAKRAPAKKAAATKRTPAKKVAEPAKKVAEPAKKVAEPAKKVAEPAKKAPAAKAPAVAKKASQAVSSEVPAKATGTATRAAKKAEPPEKAAPSKAVDPAGTPPKKAQPAKKAAKKTD